MQPQIVKRALALGVPGKAGAGSDALPKPSAVPLSLEEQEDG